MSKHEVEQGAWSMEGNYIKEGIPSHEIVHSSLHLLIDTPRRGKLINNFERT